MGSRRKDYPAAFKGKVSLAGLKGGKTLTQLSGEFGVHILGHVLSYLYDTAHGATLSIVYPAWMRHIGQKAPDRIIELGQRLFGVGTVEETVKQFEAFYQKIGSPVRAAEAGIAVDKAEEILELMHRNKASGMHHILNADDREEIVRLMMA